MTEPIKKNDLEQRDIEDARDSSKADDATHDTTPPAGADVKPTPTDTTDDTDKEGVHTLTDSALAKRLERERRSTLKALLDAAGVESDDELKTLLEDAKKRREGELSDLQKEQRARQQAEKERDDLRQQNEALRRDLRTERLSVAVRSAARDAEHPEDVLDWIEEHEREALDAAFDEDGVISDAQIKKLVNKCRSARPKWFGSASADETPGVPSNSGAKAPQTKQQVQNLAAYMQRQIKSGF